AEMRRLRDRQCGQLLADGNACGPGVLAATPGPARERSPAGLPMPPRPFESRSEIGRFASIVGRKLRFRTVFDLRKAPETGGAEPEVERPIAGMGESTQMAGCGSTERYGGAIPRLGA